MANNFATTAGKMTRDTRMSIPMLLIAGFGVLIGLFAAWEDYNSSWYGYNMLPTRKTGEEVVTVIALLPQIGQIIFFYMFGRSVEIVNGRRKLNYLYFFIAFFLLLFDLGTDMFFKASGLEWHVWIIAFIESITIFTIGSEMLLVGSLGLFIELAPKAFKQVAQIFAEFVGDGDDEDERQQGQGKPSHAASARRQQS